MQSVIPQKFYEDIIPGVALVFLTPKGLHMLTYEQPLDKMKIYIHKIPSSPKKIEKMVEKMEEVKKEYDN